MFRYTATFDDGSVLIEHHDEPDIMHLWNAPLPKGCRAHTGTIHHAASGQLCFECTWHYPLPN